MIGKQKILIVDDDENIAELISLYLTKECFDTKMVYNGEDALAAFDTYQPNLILLDLMLPGIDGYQVCREIRAKSVTPIIMLSAKSEVFDKVLGLELGADDYITKPFSPSELVARVKAHLARYERLIGSNVQKNDIIEIVYEYTLPRIMNGVYLVGAAVGQGTQSKHEMLTWLHGIMELEVVNQGYNSSYIEIPSKIRAFSNRQENVMFL